jgi:hypothetical protein
MYVNSIYGILSGTCHALLFSLCFSSQTAQKCELVKRLVSRVHHSQNVYQLCSSKGHFTEDIVPEIEPAPEISKRVTY